LVTIVLAFSFVCRLVPYLNLSFENLIYYNYCSKKKTNQMDNFATSDSPIPVRSSLKIDYVWELKSLKKQFKARGQMIARPSKTIKKPVGGGNRKSFLLSLQKIKNTSKDSLFKRLFSQVEQRELIEPALKL